MTWPVLCKSPAVTLRTYGSVLILVSACATLACGSSATTSANVTAPAESRCDASVSSSAVSFTLDGGTGTLTIAVARECAWRATSPVDWITFTTAVEGQGDGTVGYRVSENRDPITRQAQLSVADRQVTLNQGAAPCRFMLGSAPSSFDPQGGQASIDLSTHAVCEWSAASHSAWAAVSPSSGRGAGRITVTVSPNAGSERPVVVSIAGLRVEMAQRAAPAPPPPTPVPQPPAPPPAPTPPTPTPNPPAPTPTPAPTPPAPTPVRSIKLDGEAREVSGSCPTKTFQLENRTVYTTEQTAYERGDCDDLRNRARIDEVRGTLMSDGRVRAEHVKFKK
jgi:hypothetical protein